MRVARASGLVIPIFEPFLLFFIECVRLVRRLEEEVLEHDSCGICCDVCLLLV
jgi:hypothetical protein